MEFGNNTAEESRNDTQTSSLIRNASKLTNAILEIADVTQTSLEATGSQISSLENSTADYFKETEFEEIVEIRNITTSHVVENKLSSTESNWYYGYDYVPNHLANNESNSLLLNETITSIPFLLHIYGFATLYIWLDFFIVFVSFTSKKRVVKRPATLGIMILFAVFSSNFIVFLTVDPYGVRNILPSAVITFILYFKYMSFMITFWLIQGILKGMSSMKQISSSDGSEYTKAQQKKVRAFIPMCLIYFCIMITIAVTTSLKPHMHILHLIPQAIYVTATIVLCFTFLYSALNISQYTKQTSRVLDETIIYSKMHSKLKENGRCTDVSLDLYRVKRDKLELQGDFSPEDDGDVSKKYGTYIHGTDSSSNESLAFFNHVALSDPAKIEEIFENRQKSFQNKERKQKTNTKHKLNDTSKINGILKQNKKNLNLKQQYAILESTTDCDFSSDNNDGSMAESYFNESNSIDQKNTFPVNLQMQQMTSMLQGTKGTASRSKLISKYLDSKALNHNHTTVFCNNAFSCDNLDISPENKEHFNVSNIKESSYHKDSNRFYDCNSLCNTALKNTSNTSMVIVDNETTYSNSIRKSNSSNSASAATIIPSKNGNAKQQNVKFPKAEHLTKTANFTLTIPSRGLLPNDRCEDNGYLADIENALIEEANDIDEQGYDQNEEIGHENSYKTSCQKSPILPKRHYNYLGLQRVRKGRCVKKIMQTTYCTTVFAFLLSVLELYEMFSAKGVLTGLNSSGEYTWLLFESFLRFSEVGFAATVIRSVQIWGKPRRVVSKKPAIEYTDIHYSANDDSDSPNVQSMC